MKYSETPGLCRPDQYRDNATASVSGSDLNANPPADTSDGSSGANPPAPIVSVAAPETLDFIMDPYELAGRGSIWSQEYAFINKGNVPIKISLSKLHCMAANDVFIAEENEEIAEDGKAAALWLYLDNGSSIRITEDDTAYEFILEPEDSLLFWIRGNMSTHGQWKNGDINISLQYSLKAAGNME